MTTVAGNGDNYYYGDDGPATAAALAYPQGVAVDPDGRVVFCDTNNLRIRTVDDDGDIQTLAGTGSPRYSGDGGAATSALLSRPASLATDSQGRMVFSDRLNNRIWRVARDGTIESVAGRGVAEFGGDGGPATEAYVRLPMGLAIDSQDRIVFADGSNHRIRRIDTDGIITTIAGTGAAGFAGDDGPGTLAQLQFPTGLAVDADGRVLFTDWGNHRIRRIDTDGTITTIVGTGVGGFSGDGGPAALAQVDRPFGLTVDADGHVFIADTYNQRVRVIDTAGDIHTFAGVGTSGAAGDGGDALAAQLSLPFDVATDADGGVYIADAGNHRVRRVDAAGTISTVAGTGALGFVGDGGPATAAALYDVGGVAIGLDGEVLLADTRNNRIRRIDDGVITTIAGQVDPPRMGPLARAQLATPTALTITPAFTLIAGGTSGTVQRVRPDAAVLEVVAGRYPHTPGTGALARFRDVTFGAVGGVAWDPVGAQLYLTETTNHVIHVVTPVDPNDPSTWTIATLAGAAGAAAFADGALATARFRDPTGLWLDVDARRLYVADTGNHVVRAIDLDRATVATVAGTPATRGYFGDDGAATDALLFAPEAVVGCPGGDLFVADTGNHRIRRVATATGLITSVLGDGVAASSGEGTPANIFPVDAPRGLACDDLGNLFVASTATIRLLAADDDGVVDGSGAVSTIYGLPPRDESPANLTRCIAGVAVRDAEAVQLVDSCVGLLVELTRQPLP
jgi:sugar lactone lactonase YvrE